MEQESVFSVRTKGNAPHQGKPRVYFTCHPADFERCFDQLCEDVFKTHDCAVYYTPDMAIEIPEDERENGLAEMNLFLIPVSLKLLTTPNRAMDVDLPFAVAHHIRVFPILLEPGLDPIYNRKDRFGDRQYLDPFCTDPTAIPYEEKLKAQLNSALVSDELAEQIRKEFDARIFLSYRKKDRRFANQLMRLIHSDPICRDVAIWYDEFLTAGTDFNQVIANALETSHLFAMLITPHMFEKDNYAFYKEYKIAHAAGIPVLPAKMEKTDPDDLQKLHPGDLPVVDAYDRPALKEGLLEKLRGVALRENDGDPRHNFLIGLAYSEGIDVEKDIPRAVELITSAAEADLPEAMQAMHAMYRDGYGVERDLRMALHWAEAYADYFRRTYGEEHPDTLTALRKLAISHSALGQHAEALKLHEKIYTLRCSLLGEEHPHTLVSLSDLADSHGELGHNEMALQLKKKAYAKNNKVYGEEHPNTLSALNNLALTYSRMGRHTEALEKQETVSRLFRRLLGEEHPDTLTSLNNLAITYGALYRYTEALEIDKKVYALRCKVLGEKHPDTLTSLSNLALTVGKMGHHQKAVELHGKVYALRREALGEEHPVTLTTLSNWGNVCKDTGFTAQAEACFERLYPLSCKVYGEEHSQTLAALNSLLHIYRLNGEQQKTIALHKETYARRRELMGEEHPATLRALKDLAQAYKESDDPKRAVEYFERLYSIYCKAYGKDSLITLHPLNDLAFAYGKAGDLQSAANCLEGVYPLCCKLYGEEHPNTLYTLNTLNALRKALSTKP